jgi:hypothetical protein
LRLYFYYNKVATYKRSVIACPLGWRFFETCGFGIPLGFVEKVFCSVEYGVCYSLDFGDLIGICI